ncbi:MAG: P1 family peptidase [Candidatus Limnocylindrales bacterium]
MVRARDLGIILGHGTPGHWNAITDVAGVRVGHTTIIKGDGPLVVGHGPVRTGVTVVLAHEGNVWAEPVFAGCHRLNGNGELTGLEWVRESGQLMSPIGLTNTHSVGVVRDALIASEIAEREPGEVFWGLPVVGETWDGRLNDFNGLHVKPEHVFAALRSASSGRVPEGNVGSGTGMVCHGFKGGIGTSSRVVRIEGQAFTLGVLVQANYGRRERLRVDGVPVGEEIPSSEVPLPIPPPVEGGGSIIVLVATDAPLLPHQLTRVAQRPAIGIGRMGGVGEQTSGDLFLAFSTGNRVRATDMNVNTSLTFPVSMLSDSYITAIFDATVEATEEAILNCLLSAETMTGRDGITAHRLPPDRLVEVMRKYNRPAELPASA